MKCIYFLVFVGVAQGFVVEHKEKRDLKLSAPVMAGLVANDDSLTVQWNKVDNPDSSDPVLGYIVKVWELRESTVYRHEIVDGKKVLVADSGDAKMNPNVIPTETPREIKVEGADTTKVDVKDIKRNVQYHIRVLAYTKNHQGPLSNATGIKLLE